MIAYFGGDYRLMTTSALVSYTKPPQGCLESILRGHHAELPACGHVALHRRAETIQAVDEGSSSFAAASITTFWKRPGRHPIGASPTVLVWSPVRNKSELMTFDYLRQSLDCPILPRQNSPPVQRLFNSPRRSPWQVRYDLRIWEAFRCAWH